MNPKKPILARGVPPLLNQQAGAPRQFKPVVAQLKTRVPAKSVAPLVALPVYRPQATPKAAQRKMPNEALNRKPPVAPSVFRSQQVPAALQTKGLWGQGAQAGTASRQPVAPAVYRPQAKKIVQPKPIAKSLTPPAVYRRPDQKRGVPSTITTFHGHIIQRQLTPAAVKKVANHIFQKSPNAESPAVLEAIPQAVKETEVKKYDAKIDIEKIQAAYNALRKEAAAQKQLDDLFAPDKHVTLSIDLITRYRDSKDYIVWAREEYNQKKKGNPKQNEYGVEFHIVKRSNNLGMFGHFHAHYKKDFKEMSGHFKHERDGDAGRAADEDADAATAFTQYLQGQSLVKHKSTKLK